VWRDLQSALKGLENCAHEHVNFPEKRLKYYRLLNGGENWRDLPAHLQKEAMGKSFFSGGGKTGFYRRLSWNDPAPTLVTHPAMPATDLCHPKEDRPLSVQEYLRIQQFPDDWIVCGKTTEKYRQIGNAVPAGLGHAVGSLVLKLLSGEQIKQIDGFKYSRYRNTSHAQTSVAQLEV
jgi:DNA (cytosine-5)-methyltransferase 1